VNFRNEEDSTVREAARRPGSGETVLLSMESAMYYGLDQVGSRIWELVREPIRVSDLRDAITREYDVEPERCEADVLGFLRELADKGLIEVRIAP